MTEQTGPSEVKKDALIWPERERGEDPEVYWVRVLDANLRVPAANFEAIATVFGSIMGQKEKREGRDGLTGLKTFPFFHKDIAEAIDHAYRQREAGKPEKLCVVLVDIDDLKKLNLELGHQRADGIIIEMAEQLKLGRRKEDAMARLGGDEFAVLLPDCDAQGAVKISEVIRRNMERRSEATISVGVAELGRHDSAEELLEKAQVARELAKGNHVGEYLMPGEGKNRVVTWWEGMPLQVEQK